MSGSFQFEESPAPSTFQLLIQPGRPLLRSTLLFAIVSALDLIMTWTLLTHDEMVFVESNPVARYFLYGWGLLGMLYFKLSIVSFVAILCQVIARSRMDIARRLLYFATATVSAVVLYSLGLMLVHTR